VEIKVLTQLAAPQPQRKQPKHLERTLEQPQPQRKHCLTLQRKQPKLQEKTAGLALATLT